jgi:predicted amidohydrolase YtcJ
VCVKFSAKLPLSQKIGEKMLKKILAASLFISFILPGLEFAQTKQKVSLLLHNGKVFTADAQFSIAEAVAVDGEKIVAVGTSKNLKAKYSAAKEIDLKGRLVTPGFNDAHAHFLRGALALLNVDLTGAKTLAVAQNKVAEKAKTLKSGEWLTGRGWDHTLWGGKFPGKADLDKVAPNNPVYLVRVDGHVGWANSAALKLAGIDKNTANPNGGEIERDANGEATGIMKETAQGLIARLVPPPTPEQSVKGLELALDIAKKYGITSVHDISGYETTKLYRQFLQQDKLTVRITEMQNFADSVAELKRQRAEFATFKDNPSRLKLGALKGYVDGTLGSKTAAMLAPFSDDPHNSGIPRNTPEELTKMIVERDKAGFQLALHAIGDRANRMALDGFGEALKQNQKAKDFTQAGKDGGLLFSAEAFAGIFIRHRIEHAQVVNPSDFKRFAELGIIASMQPTHAISDKRWAESRLGEYRVLGSYAWHLMRSYGVHVPFGTDFPVESINPYRTLYAAVSRQDEEGNPVGGWQPQERMTMAEAIRAHTYESAYAEYAESEKGVIAPGMFADLIVHSKDLLTIPHKEIMQTEPVYTIFNGKVIYGNN